MQHLAIFQALSDPTRMRIVGEIGPHERAVGDIVARLGIQQSGVSRHLRILEEAGIVQMRPDAQRRLYSLRKEAFDRLDEWVSEYRKHWEDRLDRLGSALERKRRAPDRSKETSE